MRFSTFKHFRQTKRVTELASGQGIQRRPTVFRYQFQYKKQVGPSGKAADKKIIWLWESHSADFPSGTARLTQRISRRICCTHLQSRHFSALEMEAKGVQLHQWSRKSLGKPRRRWKVNFSEKMVWSFGLDMCG